jgi:hypothetical protein
MSNVRPQKTMDIEDPFLLQLAKAIQTWLWIETEIYSLYSVFMKGANSHLVSATFNSIHSFEAKLSLLNSCFVLVFDRHSEELGAWKGLRTKLEKLNQKRNKLVHEPVSIHYNNGTTTVSLGPSYFNALALVKGQTTHQGQPVVSAEYNLSNVFILEDHRLSQVAVAALERTFRSTAKDVRSYRESIEPKVATAIQAAKKERQ